MRRQQALKREAQDLVEKLQKMIDNKHKAEQDKATINQRVAEVPNMLYECACVCARSLVCLWVLREISVLPRVPQTWISQSLRLLYIPSRPFSSPPLNTDIPVFRSPFPLRFLVPFVLFFFGTPFPCFLVPVP